MAEDNIKLGKFSPVDTESCATEWEAYKRQFLIHLDAKGLYDAPGRRKVGQLLSHMSAEHVSAYDSFIWAERIPEVKANPGQGIEAAAEIPGEDKYNLETVFKKFDQHFGVHKYRSVKRQDFLSTTRQPGQTIMSFIAVLKAKAKHCDYGQLEESIIVDMIINKINDPKCTERLMELNDEQLSLSNVTRLCRQLELTRAHVKSLQNDQGEADVHYIQNSRGRGRDRGRMRGYQYRRESQCIKCCRHHPPEYCRADSEFCGACGAKGHYKASSLCRERYGQPRRGQDHYRGSRGRRGRGYRPVYRTA